MVPAHQRPEVHLDHVAPAEGAVARAVMVGLGTGLVGGGMVVPLGPSYAKVVLHGGPAGFGLLLTSLGVGVAVGVLGLSALQRRLPKERLFPNAVLGAGAALLVATSMSSLALTMLFVGLMGVCAGTVYVIGISLLQERVDDELRGRIFATLYTVIRVCLVAALALAPLLAQALKHVAPQPVHVGGIVLHLTGARLTLWLGGAIIVVAGVLATRAMGAQPLARD